MIHVRWKMTALAVALASGTTTYAAIGTIALGRSEAIPVSQISEAMKTVVDAVRESNAFYENPLPPIVPMFGRRQLMAEPLVDGLIMGLVAPLPQNTGPLTDSDSPSVDREAKPWLFTPLGHASFLPTSRATSEKPMLLLSSYTKKDPYIGQPAQVNAKSPRLSVASNRLRKMVSAPPPPRMEDTRVTLDFVNTEVVQILKALAMQSGTNVVTGPEVKGTLTVSLHDVTVESALKLVTSLAGIEFAQVGDTYIVASHERIGTVRRQITGEADPVPEAIVSVAYLVRGGKAADLITAVCGKEKTTFGAINLTSTPLESSSNQAIVLRGPEGEVARLRAVFEQIDRQGSDDEQFEILQVRHVNPSALREELIVAVPGLRASVAPSAAANPRSYTPNKAATDASTVAGDLKRMGGGGGKEGGGAGGGGASGGDNTSSDAKSKEDIRDLRNARGLSQPFSEFEPTGVPMRLVLRGTPEQILKAKAFAAKVDLAPKQVALELRVMELNREEALRVGVDWSIAGPSGSVRLIRINNGLGDTATTSGTISGTFSQGSSVTATLDSISNRQNLIARPNLLAIDGRESELFVGDVIRYIKSIQATQNGTTVIVDEERVGVRLAVFPRVGADGSISLDMRPVLSYLRGYTAVPGGGQLPQTSERVAQATAILKSGETIAIGGLIQDQDRRDVKGIPFLKDLPLFGSLFRRIEKSRDRTEVVFFLTAKVVDESDRANAAEPKPEPIKTKK